MLIHLREKTFSLVIQSNNMSEIDEDKLIEACDAAHRNYENQKGKLESDKRKSDFHYRLRLIDIDQAINKIIKAQIALAEFRGHSTSELAQYYKETLGIK